MRKLTMSMCASRDYMLGYNKAVDDFGDELDSYRKALENIANYDGDKYECHASTLARIAREALEG